jgi:uncharacterized membrane protein YbhN (UPF0104 family)
MSKRQSLVVFISLGLLALMLWLIDFENLLIRLKGFSLAAIAGIFSLFLVNIFVVSFRFWRVLAHFGIPLSWNVASRASVSGHVAGLFMISLFGQVLGRQVILRNFGVQPVVIAALAAYERAVLAIVSGLLGFVGASYLLGQAAIAEFMARISLSEIVLVFAAGSGLSLWLGRSVFEARLSAQTLTWKNLQRLVEIGGITLLSLLITQLCFVVGILAIGAEVAIFPLMAAAAVISFAAAIPISVGGWGVRELAAVTVLGLMGVAAEDALSVSIIVGLCSTLVIVSVAPISLRRSKMKSTKIYSKPMMHSPIEIEKTAAWLLGMITTVAVFFQVYITLPGGVVNVNLADPFAILALAAVVLHCVFNREWPNWRLLRFNQALLVLSLLLILGFVRGWLEIGITQWALGGRLIGWLILLGYLSAGYILLIHAGRHGLRRLVETMAATAAMVVLAQMMLRVLVHWGLNLSVYIAPNFEGYAGNRNAFAFQLLTSMVLLLAYTKIFSRYVDRGGWKHALLIPLMLGAMSVGLVWSGSRAGLAVGAMLLVVASIGFSDRKTIVRGMLVAAFLWALSYFATLESAGGLLVQSAVQSTMQSTVQSTMQSTVQSTVQSTFSGDYSDTERWATFTHAFDLWRESPLLGAGLGVFIAKSATWLGHPQVIHSTPLWVLAEFGLLGVAVFGWLVWMFCCYFWRERASPIYRALLMLLAAVSVFSLAHEIFYQRIFWLVLGALLARSITANKI